MELNNFSDVFNGGNSGNTSSFNGGITNDGGSSELYRLTLTTDEPNDWSSEIAIGSNTYTTTVDTTVSGSSLLNFNLNVNPGSTPYVATYTIELESLDDPSMPHQTARYTVMSGITDLVVTNGAEADLSESTFLNGLASAGNTTYGIMPASTFKIAGSLNQLGSLINVYYNVGWTFPCFDDEMVTVMSAFNDNEIFSWQVRILLGLHLMQEALIYLQ
ncbi:MAG: hypothetical protein R2799_01395 [Crocinitomicaceae bacterium]